MSGEGIALPEQEPTTFDIAAANRMALEQAILDPELAGMADDLMFTGEDEVALYQNEDGSPVDAETAWENTVGWWMQLGLDPVDYFAEGFIEQLGLE